MSDRPEADPARDPSGAGQVVTYPRALPDSGGDEGAERAEVIALHQELALMEERLHIREDALVKLNQRLRALEGDLAKEAGRLHADVLARAAANEKEIERLETELALRDEALDAARHELDTLLATKTFRWTRAVRSLYARLTPPHHR